MGPGRPAVARSTISSPTVLDATTCAAELGGELLHLGPGVVDEVELAGARRRGPAAMRAGPRV